MALLNRIRNKLGKLNYRRNYYLSKVAKPAVPVAPLHYLPPGFTVNVVGDTGLRVIDNFCTREEARVILPEIAVRFQTEPSSRRIV